MSEIRLQYQPLSKNIEAGRLNKAGTMFTSAPRTDVTSDVLWAFIQYGLNVWDGQFSVDGYNITIEKVPSKEVSDV